MSRLFYGSEICNGVKIHYHRTSQGFYPLVLLHGLLDAGLCWNRLSLALHQFYDVYLPDARGHGYSECPEEPFYFDDMAEDVTEFIKKLAIQRPVLIGHSMGAALAAKVAAAYPDLIAAIVLIDPPWYDPELMTQELADRMTSGFKDELAKMKQMTYEEIATYCQTIHPNWNADDIRPWSKTKQQVDPRILEITPEISIDWMDTAAKIQIPALIMTGNCEHGAILSQSQLKELLRDHPNWESTYYEESGHNIQRDCYSKTKKDVLNYLFRVTSVY